MTEVLSLDFRWIKRLGALGAVCFAIGGCALPHESERDGPFELELVDESRPAERGTLAVPLRHDDPEGPKIWIRFVRVFGEDRGVAPFFFLAGGPGASGTSKVLRRGARLTTLEKLILKHTDIVFIDQRGTGAAVPRLVCDDPVRLPLVPAPDRAFLLAEKSRAAKDCAKLWRERGTDLQAFNTAESARDLEALRRRLQLPKINILAASYGTHLAFAYLRHFDATVNLGVLSNIAGPDHGLNLPFQIDDLLKAIDKHAPLPDGRSLELLAEQVRARLASAPVRVGLEDETVVEVGEFDFQRFLARATARYDVHRRLPSAIARMADGDLRELAQLRLAAKNRKKQRLHAMSAAMNCASSASSGRLRSIADQAPSAIAGRANSYLRPEICRAWGVKPLPAEFRSTFNSRVPLLLFSGTFDARSPVSNGQEMLEWFPKAHHVIVSGMGHDWCRVEACLEIVEELLTNGRIDRPRVIEISPTHEEIDRSRGRLNKAR